MARAGLLLAAVALSVPGARAQDDPFAVLDGPASAPAGEGVAAPPPPPAACDDIAAAAAAADFQIFVGAVVAVAALLGVALWFGLERRAVASWGLRWVAGILAAGLLAGGLVYANPFASDAALTLMADGACQHHFLLASAGAAGQGLVLGFLPALAACFVLLLIARRVL